MSIILLDMDGVIVDMAKNWRNVYNERYNDNISAEEFGSFYGGLHELVKPECGEKIYDLLKEPGFFERLDPMPGAVDGVQLLVDSGNDVVLVTSASGDAEISRGKIIWVEKNLPFLDPKTAMVMTRRKELVYGDVLVDDSVENLVDWASFPSRRLSNDLIYTIAMAAGHNVDAVENFHIDDRAEDWTHLLDIFKLLGFVK